jgi:hypothetical protein
VLHASKDAAQSQDTVLLLFQNILSRQGLTKTPIPKDPQDHRLPYTPPEQPNAPKPWRYLILNLILKNIPISALRYTAKATQKLGLVRHSDRYLSLRRKKMLTNSNCHKSLFTYSQR